MTREKLVIVRTVLKLRSNKKKKKTLLIQVLKLIEVKKNLEHHYQINFRSSSRGEIECGHSII